MLQKWFYLLCTHQWQTGCRGFLWRRLLCFHCCSSVNSRFLSWPCSASSLQLSCSPPEVFSASSAELPLSPQKPLTAATSPPHFTTPSHASLRQTSGHLRILYYYLTNQWRCNHVCPTSAELLLLLLHIRDVLTLIELLIIPLTAKRCCDWQLGAVAEVQIRSARTKRSLWNPLNPLLSLYLVKNN